MKRRREKGRVAYSDCDADVKEAFERERDAAAEVRRKEGKEEVVVSSRGTWREKEERLIGESSADVRSNESYAVRMEGREKLAPENVNEMFVTDTPSK